MADPSQPSRPHAAQPVRISHYPRTDGKLPDRAKWVGRPSRFGNPHDHRILGRVEAVRRYRADLYAGRLPVTVTDVLDQLDGYDELACRCPLDGEPCHGDVLVEVLRQEVGR